MNTVILPLLVIVRLTLLDAFRRRILWVLFFLTVVVVGLVGHRLRAARQHRP